MKGFIEVTSAINGAKILIEINSISLVEEYPQKRARIVLKERVELNGNNLEVITTANYSAIKTAITIAQG